MATSNFLDGSSDSTYRQYVRIGRLFLKYPAVWTLVQDLNKDARMNKLSPLGVTHLDDNVLFSAAAEDFAVFVRAASNCINSKGQSSNFNSSLFYAFAHETISRLNAYHGREEVSEKCGSWDKSCRQKFPRPKLSPSP